MEEVKITKTEIEEVAIYIHDLDNPIELQNQDLVKERCFSNGFFSAQINRKWFRKWVIYYLGGLFVCFFCAFTYICFGEITIGWLVSTFLLFLFTILMKTPQLMYLICCGFPIPTFLWLEGANESIFEL